MLIISERKSPIQAQRILKLPLDHCDSRTHSTNIDTWSPRKRENTDQWCINLTQFFPCKGHFCPFEKGQRPGPPGAPLVSRLGGGIQGRFYAKLEHLLQKPSHWNALQICLITKFKPLLWRHGMWTKKKFNQATVFWIRTYCKTLINFNNIVSVLISLFVVLLWFSSE